MMLPLLAMLLAIATLIAGAGLLALAWWLRSRDVKVSWYEWLIGAMGLLLILLFTIPNYFGSLAEGEPAAASMFLLITGLPAIILLAVAAGLIWRRQRAAG